MQRKIPLIYILSNGRSGSTLLDLLLGAHPNIWTLGEAQILPWELRENRYPCGCGASIAECEFWSSVLPQIPLDSHPSPIGHFRDQYGGGRVLRWGLLLDVLKGRVGGRWGQTAEEYGRLNAQYFEAVWQSASKLADRPIHWLVDASKDPYRLLWLQASGLFDLRVIHLVKDPRAFVFSMTRAHLPGALGKVSRMTGRWLIENTLFSRLCGKGFSADQTFLLRYDQLAGKPGEALASIGDWLDLEFPTTLVDDFRKLPNHAVSGNKMRWQSSGIRLDDRWRTALPKPYAFAIWAITWPLARSYSSGLEGSLADSRRSGQTPSQ